MQTKTFAADQVHCPNGVAHLRLVSGSDVFCAHCAAVLKPRQPGVKASGCECRMMPNGVTVIIRCADHT